MSAIILQFIVPSTLIGLLAKLKNLSIFLAFCGQIINLEQSVCWSVVVGIQRKKCSLQRIINKTSGMFHYSVIIIYYYLQQQQQQQQNT